MVQWTGGTLHLDTEVHVVDGGTFYEEVVEEVVDDVVDEVVDEVLVLVGVKDARGLMFALHWQFVVSRRSRTSSQ